LIQSFDSRKIPAVVTTMVPPEAARPDVLPTERLGPTGMALPELRARYRTIADGRNALTVATLWLVTLAIVELGVRPGWWWLAILCFVAMGPIHARFAILMHEAAHKLLFTSKRANDLVGTWLLAYPAMVPIGLYRRSHFAHHKEEFGPDEPDLAFYSGYPGRPNDLGRRLVRDAVGISGWKNFRVLLTATRTAQGRRVAVPILAVQVVLFAALWAATGAWWAYPVFWWLSWMTQWRVLNRLRAIAEHGGMIAGKDRRVTTHCVRQHWLARLWFVPYNTGWHLAHHVDMGVPWRHLPAFHDELRRAGYVTEALTYTSYLELWRAACSAPAEVLDLAEGD
jgi:fatty acid desaturase